MKKYILYILLFALFIATPVYAQQRGVSYKQGYARNGFDSLRPNLWRGLVFAQKYSLGVTGTTTTRDVSGFHRDGTMNGSMTLDDWVISAGGRRPAGYALDFDGVDDWITTPFILNPASGDFSIVGWIELEAEVAGNNQVIFQQEGAGGRTWLFRGTADNTLKSFLGSAETTSVGTIDIGVWYHIGLTVTGTTVQLYIDGVTDGSSTKTMVSETSGMRFGASKAPSETSEEWLGLIDDIRIYNRALSVQEVWDTYQFPNAMFQTRRVAIGRPPDVAPAARRFIFISKLMNNLTGGIAQLYRNN